MTTYTLIDQPDENVGVSTVVTAQHFGVNALLDDPGIGPENLETVSDLGYLGVQTLRYPGGSVTEELFDISSPEALTAIADDGEVKAITPLSEFLDLASETGSSVTIVLPTRNGLDQSAADALDEGNYGNRMPDQAYLEQMATFVVETMQKAADRGVTINSFELGNEFWLKGRMTATEYGRLAADMAVTVQDALLHGEPTISIADQPDILIQSVSNAGLFSPRFNTETTFYVDGQLKTFTIPGQGRDTEQLDAIKAAITTNAANAIDGIVDHYYDKQGFGGIDEDGNEFGVDFTGQRIFEQIDELTTWIEGLRDSNLPELVQYVTEWNVKRNSDFERDGLKGASVVVEMFYEMVTHDIDAAHFWPLVNGTTQLQDEGVGVSIAGEIFRFMSESLIGLSPELDFSVSGAIDVHGYGNSDRDVLIVSERSGVSQSKATLDISSVYNGGHSFVVMTHLSDGDAGGADSNAEPIVTYSSGKMATAQTLTFDIDPWSLTRVEITYIDDGDDLVIGRDGRDMIEGHGGDDTILGNGGKDNLNGNDGNDWLSGGDGDDKVRGHAGNDTIYGGFGDDSLHGGDGIDLIYGGEGNEFSLAGNGNDQVWGDGGDDTLNGQDGDDTIDGGSGDDMINGGLGNDSLFGGSGSDRFVFAEGYGDDTISDFDATDQFEVIDLRSVSSISSFDDLISNHASEVSGDVVIDIGDGETLTVEDTVLADLTDQNVLTFDALGYIASYADLSLILGANADAGFQHKEEYGQFEGRVASFEALSYIASYFDLILAFGSNVDAGAAHYIQHGIYEGRTTTFDELHYIASYGDLIQAFGTNEDAGAAHYIEYGVHEGRSVTFDAEQYLANYSDLQQAFGDDLDAAALHFIQFGFAEGRTDSREMSNAVSAAQNLLTEKDSLDNLIDSAGSDTLVVDQVDDAVNGEAGSDTFVFAEKQEQDIVTDFFASNDGESIDVFGVSSIERLDDFSDTMTQDGLNICVDDVFCTSDLEYL